MVLVSCVAAGAWFGRDALGRPGSVRSREVQALVGVRCGGGGVGERGGMTLWTSLVILQRQVLQSCFDPLGWFLCFSSSSEWTVYEMACFLCFPLLPLAGGESAGCAHPGVTNRSSRRLAHGFGSGLSCGAGAQSPPLQVRKSSVESAARLIRQLTRPPGWSHLTGAQLG